MERQGWRYHMSNVMAAIGRVQLTRLDGEFAPKRRELAELYRERLSGVPGVALLTAEPEAWIVPHIFPVRILNGRQHDVHRRAGRQWYSHGPALQAEPFVVAVRRGQAVSARNRAVCTANC